jgi:hypothetical protein
MKQHTIMGESIIAAAGPSLDRIGPLVRASHERWDGRGYPDGLLEEEIPLGARIITICDSFRAMLDERVYKRAMSLDDALGELRRCAGSSTRTSSRSSAASSANGAHPSRLRPPGRTRSTASPAAGEARCRPRSAVTERGSRPDARRIRCGCSSSRGPAARRRSCARCCRPACRARRRGACPRSRGLSR